MLKWCLGQEVVAAERLALRLPLRPGVWTVSLYIRQSVPRGYTEYIPGSKTHFYVSPLNFAYSKVVTKNAESLNRGVAEDDELNDKQKPLKVGKNSKSPDLLTPGYDKYINYRY